IIAGLETASSGRVVIDGRDVTDLPPAQRGVAMVFQNYALFPHLSVADNIAFGLSVRKVPADETAKRLSQTAELLGLTALLDRKPSQLSGGQQQRVALGRALVAQAKVCLMDEPLSNLDAQLRQEMRTELRQLQQRLGLTVVYVTHDQAEAMSMADQVVLLHRGRIEQAATPRALYAQPATTFAASFIGTPSMNLLKLDGDRIAGSEVPAGRAASWLGVRPESVTLGGHVPATVRSIEYLGADLILHCGVGTESLTVRTGGQAELAAGSEVLLDWEPSAAHHFNSQGQRLQ
ncbi:MAG TPA: ABC transporter ATP-binding protein, partial [Ramlibacter sp.]|nr:ABC transporter ATP-binding protein [Ramlibacter sp.]